MLIANIDLKYLLKNMPNLVQIDALRDRYFTDRRNYAVNESVSNKDIKEYVKTFTSTKGKLHEAFEFTELNQNLYTFLERQVTVDIVLLFIDITNFSVKCSKLNNSQLSNFLDDYYNKVIPIIYQYGGEIEKIIGDGIICIFGKPFLTGNKSYLLQQADKCSKDIIMELMGTNMEVKVALHDGDVMYYKNKSVNYPEYTIIGKPITELFRLESVSENNSINLYDVSPFHKEKFSRTGIYFHSKLKRKAVWVKTSKKAVKLKGVSFSDVRKIMCVKKRDY